MPEEQVSQLLDTAHRGSGGRRGPCALGGDSSCAATTGSFRRDTSQASPSHREGQRGTQHQGQLPGALLSEPRGDEVALGRRRAGRFGTRASSSSSACARAALGLDSALAGGRAVTRRGGTRRVLPRDGVRPPDGVPFPDSPSAGVNGPWGGVEAKPASSRTGMSSGTSRARRQPSKPSRQTKVRPCTSPERTRSTSACASSGPTCLVCKSTNQSGSDGTGSGTASSQGAGPLGKRTWAPHSGQVTPSGAVPPLLEGEGASTAVAGHNQRGSTPMLTDVG